MTMIDMKRDTRELTSSLPGGRYEAFQNEDGTWNIYDVEIMADTTIPTTTGEKVRMTRAWMESAVVRAQARLTRDKYLSPAHVRHHEQGVDTEPAGKFLPKAVRLGQHEGRQHWVMYADLLCVSPMIYDRIVHGDLSYRSPEIININVPEVNSLALLKDETPFYRWPLLTIGIEHRMAIDPTQAIRLGEAVTIERDAPLIACRAIGDRGINLLFDFSKENTMATKTGAKLAEDPKGEKKDEKDGAKLEMENMTIEQALAFLKEIMPKLHQMMETLSGCGASDAEPATENLDPVELKATNDAVVSLKAQIAKQDAEIVKLRQDREIDAAVTKGVAKLRPYGVDAVAAEKQIREIALKHGLPAVDLWLSARVEGVTPEPSLSADEFTADASDADLAEFCNQGPAVAEQAIKLAAEFDELKARKVNLSVDRKTYVADALEFARIKGSFARA